MNVIEKHFANARQYIQEKKGFLQEGKVPSVYRGYVSSFGVDVRQSGVLPTLLLYSATDANTQEKDARPMVAGLVGQLLGHTTSEAFIKHAYACNASPGQRNKFRREVMDAAVALKLAMRTFPFDDDKKTPTPAEAQP